MSRHVFVIGAVSMLLLAGCGGGSSSTSTSPSTSDHASIATAERAANELCVKLWNGTENRFSEMANSIAGGGDAYVSVGYSADFPDKCLVTVAGATTSTAMQFTEAGGQTASLGSYAPVDPDGIPVSQLDESSKQWNAKVIDEQGHIALD
jgi:hypothetical protein